MKKNLIGFVLFPPPPSSSLRWGWFKGGFKGLFEPTTLWFALFEPFRSGPLPQALVQMVNCHLVGLNKCDFTSCGMLAFLWPPPPSTRSLSFEKGSRKRTREIYWGVKSVPAWELSAFFCSTSGDTDWKTVVQPK